LELLEPELHLEFSYRSPLYWTVLDYAAFLLLSVRPAAASLTGEYRSVSRMSPIAPPIRRLTPHQLLLGTEHWRRRGSNRRSPLPPGELSPLQNAAPPVASLTSLVKREACDRLAIGRPDLQTADPGRHRLLRPARGGSPDLEKEVPWWRYCFCCLEHDSAYLEVADPKWFSWSSSRPRARTARRWCQFWRRPQASRREPQGADGHALESAGSLHLYRRQTQVKFFHFFCSREVFSVSCFWT
jgi:hypothetical protein